MNFMNYGILKKYDLKNYIDRPSSFFILFPYFVFLFLNSNLSFELLGVGIFFVLFDLMILNKLKNQKWVNLIYFLLLVFFYSKIFFNDTEIVIHRLRFREFLLIFCAISLAIVSFVFRLHNGLKIFNVFILFFGLTFLFNSNSNRLFNRKIILEENNFEYDRNKSFKNNSNAPIIFLIFDELSSSKEIYKYTKDSTDLFLDIELNKRGFNVIDDFISESIHTKFSIPSIFNFNLHRNSKILDSIDKINDEVTIQKSYYWIASNNLLVDSLNNKSIKSYSYGLFPFSKGEFIDGFTYWWPSFRDPLRIFGNENLFQAFFQETLLKSIESVFLDVTSVEKFKEDVFFKLKSLSPVKNSFYYFHFYAPHEPFAWGNEYKSKLDVEDLKSENKNLNEHIRFRRYFLKKILPLIIDDKLSKSRIIISGDHGYRGSPNKINPYSTNLYLYGFDKSDFEKIKNVQDLGYLINGSFFKQIK